MLHLCFSISIDPSHKSCGIKRTSLPFWGKMQPREASFLANYFSKANLASGNNLFSSHFKCVTIVLGEISHHWGAAPRFTTHKCSNSSRWSKTATLAAFSKQCRRLNSKLCQLVKDSFFFLILPLPCTFPLKLLHPGRKVLMNESFIQCELLTASQEQFIRDLLRSAPQMSQIRTAAVFQTSACSGKSLALQSFATIIRLWFLMTWIRSNTLDWGNNDDQMITPSFVSFAVKAPFSGSRRRNRSADGWNLQYFSILFNAVVFSPVRAWEAVQVFICNSNPNETSPEWFPLLTVHLVL